MESFEVKNLTFSYPGSKNNTLDEITFSVEQGEFLTVIGKSGCGKTTLLRHLKSALTPVGNVKGDIIFTGEPLDSIDLKTQTEKIGFVSQNPDNQIVTDKVWHELAFGLESLGISTPDIRARVSEMASYFGINEWFHKKTTELSGGQKQILNLASVMAMQPSVLLLDEPTGQLDPIAAKEFLATVSKINRELGVTVIISEQRTEDIFEYTDRVIVMDKGKIIADCVPKRLATAIRNTDMMLALPVAARVFEAVDRGDITPVTVRDGRKWLQSKQITELKEINDHKTNTEAVIEVSDIWFRYEKNMPDVLKGLSLNVHRGELYAIMGGNGVGKSTTLSVIIGTEKAYRGAVKITGGKIAMLPQNPQSLFVKKSVYLDLCETVTDLKKEQDFFNEITELCDLNGLLDRHPYDLSGGEQQRVALAKVLLTRPQILLLDEPTKGLDVHYKMKLGQILQRLKKSGVTIVMVSHDIEFCAEYADKCAMLFDGVITSEAEPRRFFNEKSFYTTAANRMARGIISNAVMPDDIIAACGGTPIEAKGGNDMLALELYSEAPETEKNITEHKKKPWKTVISILLTVIAMPLTVLLGYYLFWDRKYYFISLLLILEALFPFFAAFENRKPKSGELVIISVLCAITVASRAAFFMVPHFKPMAAIIIISGICFGGGTGFLIGAVSMLISNFFFGQGPWTPWQMFAFGILGFFAGVIFNNKPKQNRIAVCIYGALSVLILYGVIMNFSNVLLWQGNPTLKAVIESCMLGLPFDAIHAAATAIFLFIFIKPILGNLERIKTKYGLE